MLPIQPTHKIPAAFLLIMMALAGKISFAQMEFPGNAEKKYHSVEIRILNRPDSDRLKIEDTEAAVSDLPYRIGEQVYLNEQLFDADEVSGGVKYERFTIEGAQALGLEFAKLDLPEGAELFVYNPENEKVLGAFTHRSFAGRNAASIRPVAGSSVVIEYRPPAGSFEKPDILLSGITYFYRGMESLNQTLKSGHCEVSVACAEGEGCRDVKNSVVKIISKVGPSSFWCSGVLVNNTSLDFTPYILTAYHCSQSSYGGDPAGESDLDRWVFYFLNERISCESSVNVDDSKTLTGASFVASTDEQQDIASDFYLLKLDQIIPASYNPYYSGWNKLDAAPSSGVCIHHPDGDDKKISTFLLPAKTGTWESTPDTHWMVNWAQTANGHGVTEGGSSGAPLFDANGYLRGTLTGGESSCSNTSGTDYYGKISWSWEPMGSENVNQLKHWLDPIALNVDVLQGMYNSNALMASFRADTTVIPVDGRARFQNLSTGDANEFFWYFEGGEPSEFQGKIPPEVVYNTAGQFKVKLLIVKDDQKDSLVIKEYLRVQSINFPNPAFDHVKIFVGKGNTSGISYELYNLQGLLVDKGSFDYAAPVYTLKLPEHKELYYMLKITGENLNETLKVLRMNE